MKKYFIFFILFIVFIQLNIKNNSITLKSEIKKDSNDNLKIQEKFGYIDGYTCKKIKVIDENGHLIDKYNLDDYVAGVVSGETHILDDETTFMAMSVIVRTYALYVTNDCKASIVNSEAAQVMDNPLNVSKKIKDAVKKTNGQVLSYNNKVIKSEYDSFYKGDGFYCDRKYCYSNYIKVGDSKNKIHKIKVPSSWQNDLAGGHGKGLSQFGAKYLSSIGYDYKKILKYFYGEDVELSTLNKTNIDGLILNKNNVERNVRPSRSNNFYYGNITNEGDPSWYVTSRSNEILASTKNNKRLKNINTDDYCKMIGYTINNDYRNPKEGSIISWGKHAAIIERVNDGTVDITEAYVGLGYLGVELSNEYLNKDGLYYNRETNKEERKNNCEKNNSGCFKRTNNVPISSLKNRWGYDFKCYVYIKE